MSLPSWVPAGERKPAPGPLLLVQSFVNTVDADLGTDLLQDPATAQAWLHEAGLLGSQSAAGPQELPMAVAVREAIRGLIASGAAGQPASAAGIAVLSRAARAGQLRFTIGADGQIQLQGRPGGSLADGLARLMLIIRDAQRDGTWARLKVCGNDECRWAFYDRSHSQRGAWCDMAACGNLIKNRNLRARRGSPDRPSARPLVVVPRDG
jgi:predicted RNA-binding Zn ribbon-like protein